jgi:hypothetical protein
MADMILGAHWKQFWGGAEYWVYASHVRIDKDDGWLGGNGAHGEWQMYCCNRSALMRCSKKRNLQGVGVYTLPECNPDSRKAKEMLMNGWA